MEVREAPNQVRIILSRSHPDLIRRLFEAEVPEVAERIIEIRALAREAGYRTKVAVTSIDSRVDAVGACVGVRGSRIKAIVDELGGEKIDIVRWNESSQILVTNALRPAEITEIALCFELGRVTVVVNEDQLSLAIGKRGQNVRLAARLTGWDIDILTPAEYNKGLDDLEKTLLGIEGVDTVFVNKLVAMGIISVMDLEEVGADPLVKELEAEQALADQIVATATEAAKTISVEIEAEKARRAAERAAEKAAAETAAAEGISLEEAGAKTGEAASEKASSDGASSDESSSDVGSSEEAASDTAVSETGEAATEEAAADDAASEEAGTIETDAGETKSEDESETTEDTGEESEPADLNASASDDSAGEGDDSTGEEKDSAGEEKELAGQEAPVQATETVEPSVELNKAGE
jgi:N utilization substance protein A